MIDAPQMLLLGAASRNVGKTEFACRLIRRYSSACQVIGVKITTVQAGDGHCPPGKTFCLTEETVTSSEKDTARMKSAGAHHVLWLRAVREHLRDGVTELMKQIPSDACVVCESNSARLFLKPGAFLVIREAGSKTIKGSCAAVLEHADRELEFYGDGWDLSPDRCSFANGRWSVPVSQPGHVRGVPENSRIMITYDEAYQQMMATVFPLPSETIDLLDAPGRILAEDIISDIDMPPFNKSGMDGYACRREDLPRRELRIIEEIPAGTWPKKTITTGTCARILTGAPVPEGADCVLMQEQTRRQNDILQIRHAETADNICRRAEDIRAGDIVLRRGAKITPAHIAVLATVGAARLKVAQRPRVAILATGSELVEPAARPGPAEIRNSNAWQLAAQAREMGATATYCGILADREDVIRSAIEQAMQTADLLLLSGGVSTGDYDFVPGILQKLGFSFEFDSVAIQPGRPTVFGKKDAVYCFGLPGNPVATFLIFEILVKPFLYRLMCHEHRPMTVEARLAQPLRRKKTQRQGSIPVRFTAPDTVELVDYHGTAHIHAMTLAHGLIFIPIGHAGFEQGERVQVRLLQSCISPG